MALSKPMQSSSRPLTMHQRPSLSTLSSSSSGLPSRQSHSRTNSHSHLSGSLNPTHRVSRRKSVTNPVPNVAALTAVVVQGEPPVAMPILHAYPAAAANPTYTPSLGPGSDFGCLPSPPASLPFQKSMPDVKDSAIDDDIHDGSGEEGSDKLLDVRFRRASEGQQLVKEKKSSRVEVRCQKCGKGYKHSSCLTKHLWEHTPEWSYTSKLLISKHQQVQLLEAASVLVAMTVKENETTTPPDSAKDSASELDSTSSAASGYSESGDRQSSVDTTPPPMSEGAMVDPSSGNEAVPFGGSSGFPPAGQLSASLLGSLVSGNSSSETDSDLTAVASSKHEGRPPSSSGSSKTGQEDRDLAAAVELLSCSFGSNSGSQDTVTLSVDAPPVPPVPAQFLDQATPLSSGAFISSFPSRQPESFTRSEVRCGNDEVMMEDSGDSGPDDDDFDMRCKAPSEEDDDGVFGCMEE